MNLSQLTSADLKVLGSLLKEKEALLARVVRIDAKLNAFAGGQTAPAALAAAAPRARAAAKPAAKPAARKVRRNRPGKFKDKILALLQGAGKEGLSVRDLAGKLGVKPQRMYVWFSASGSRMKEIKKVAPATYAWVSSPPPKS